MRHHMRMPRCGCRCRCTIQEGDMGSPQVPKVCGMQVLYCILHHHQSGQISQQDIYVTAASCQLPAARRLINKRSRTPAGITIYIHYVRGSYPPTQCPDQLTSLPARTHDPPQPTAGSPHAPHNHTERKLRPLLPALPAPLPYAMAQSTPNMHLPPTTVTVKCGSAAGVGYHNAAARSP